MFINVGVLELRNCESHGRCNRKSSGNRADTTTHIMVLDSLCNCGRAPHIALRIFFVFLRFP